MFGLDVALELDRGYVQIQFRRDQRASHGQIGKRCRKGDLGGSQHIGMVVCPRLARRPGIDCTELHWHV